jgi:hypothetical protein
LAAKVDNLGIDTGIDLTALIAAGKCISAVLGSLQVNRQTV